MVVVANPGIDHRCRRYRINSSANVAATQDVHVRAHACFQSLIQGFADQGVADRHFQHARHSGEKIAQVGLRQIVPGIDAQACGTGTLAALANSANAVSAWPLACAWA